MILRNFFTLSLTLSLSLPLSASAQQPPTNRGAPELRVCTQNLFNYGISKSKKKKAKQRRYLTERIINAGCDVIAVQEVIGGSKKQAKKRLSDLALSLSQALLSKNKN